MDSVPTHIAKYQIRAQLGTGGQGRVYLAFDPGMNRQVAIKVLTSDGDPEMLARFRTEAGTTGNLRHKNIVTVYDYGEIDGVPYLVMELLEGKNLEDILAAHDPLTLLDRVRIMQQVAEGLHCAHQNAVIHRDVKASNIMRLPDGSVKIMDFGIARVTTTTVTRRTRHGFLIGTMAYMSPEQLRDGREADAPADIFAYGTLFYELLTGIHPFRAPDSHSTMFRIISVEPPPIKQWLAECPDALERIIARAIAKERDVRYQSLEDLLLDIEPIVLELKQDRAREILLEVAPLMSTNQFEAANTKIREVLDLDPRNAEARQARELLQRQTQERNLNAKLESLVLEGDAKLTERQFSEAQRAYEHALRIRANDPRLREKLNKTLAAAEADRNASLLVEEAERHRASGNLARALERACLATSIDPTNVLAHGLRVQLEEKLDSERVERDFQDRLRRANELRTAGQFDTALEVLSAIKSPLSQKPEVTRLRDQIEAARQNKLAENEKKKQAEQFRLGLERAEQAIASGQVIQAKHLLNSMETSFGREPKAAALLSNLRNALQAREKAERLSTFQRMAGEAMAQSRFDDAADLANSGLLEFPDDSVLRGQLASGRDAATQKRRNEEIASIVGSARSLRDSTKFQDALDLLADGKAKLGDAAALEDAEREVRASLAKAEEIAAIDLLLQKGAALIPQDPAEAIKQLSASARIHPRETRFKSLIEDARTEQKRRQEIVHIREAKTRIDALESARDWEKAIVLANRVLEEYPYNEELTRRLNSLKQSLKAEQDHRKDQLRKLVSNIRLSLGRGEPNEASRLLAEGRAAFSNDPEWQAAAKEITARQASADAVKQADAFRRQGRYSEAESLLRGLESASELDPPGVALLREIEEERVQKRLEEAAEQSAAGNPGKSVELLSDLNGPVPAQLIEAVRQALTHARKALEQQKADKQQLADLQRNKERRNPASIIGSATQIFDRGNFAPEADALRNWAQQQIDRQNQERQEATRREAEAARQQAEAAARHQAEIAREQAETARHQAELARQQAEAARQQEIARQQAEASQAAQRQAEYLRAQAAQRSAPIVEPPAKSNRGLLWVLVGFVVLALVGGTIWWLRKPTTKDSVTTPVVEKLALTSPSFTTFALNESVNAKWTASGGKPPYQWSVASGRLPRGLRFDSTNGSLSGAPEEPGTFEFTIRVTDGEQVSKEDKRTLVVPEPAPISSDKTAAEQQTAKQIADKQKADKQKADKQQADKQKADKQEADRQEADRQRADKQRADEQKAKNITPPPVLIRPEDYNGPSSGTLVWRGDLPPGVTLQIRQNQASIGNVTRRLLPGIPVGITLSTPGVTLLEPPSPGNQWMGMTLKNDSGAPIQSITLSWKRN